MYYCHAACHTLFTASKIISLLITAAVTLCTTDDSLKSGVILFLKRLDLPSNFIPDEL